MAREPRPGEWMMPLLSEFLGASGEMLRIWNETGSADDKWLLTRRAAEYEIRRGPADEINDEVFRLAADKFRAQGDHDGARAMDAIVATSAELRNADLDWKHRYDARPATTAERAAVDLLAKGLLWPEGPGEVPGIDGAVYSPASLARDAGSSIPTVLAVTHAGALEIVSGFADAAQRDEWLTDRRLGHAEAADGLPIGPPAPLASAVTGPDSRTQREEHILAWLLQGGGSVGEGLEPHAFSTYSRSETYLAWQQAVAAAGGGAPPPGEVRHALARRLLRAPVWADRAVGWPFGHHALAYFDRLAATPVTQDQAEEAARCLLREDIAVAQHVQGTAGVEPRPTAQVGPAGRAELQPPELRRSEGPSPDHRM